MKEILAEDECNDTYGRIRMYQALALEQPGNVDIPSGRTVYRIMEGIGTSHHPRRKPNGTTKAGRGVSTPASFTSMRFGNTAYSKVRTVQAGGVTTMPAVKVCGQG